MPGPESVVDDCILITLYAEKLTDSHRTTRNNFCKFPARPFHLWSHPKALWLSAAWRRAFLRHGASGDPRQINIGALKPFAPLGDFASLMLARAGALARLIRMRGSCLPSTMCCDAQISVDFGGWRRPTLSACSTRCKFKKIN